MNDRLSRVLVVDDEENITFLLDSALRHFGFDVRVASNGRDAIAEVEKFAPDVILLDVMLPDLDGFEVVRRLRLDGAKVPVLFLTARDATEDKVRGLTLGGDDYVTKPFSLEEVVARIQVILRRQGASAGSSQLSFSDLELDDDAHMVRRAGQVIDLSPTEYNLLRFLMVNAGRVLSPQPDPRPRMAVRLRWSRDGGGDLHQLPPQEDRQARPAADSDRAGRRLLAAPRRVTHVASPASHPRLCCSRGRARGDERRARVDVSFVPTQPDRQPADNQRRAVGKPRQPRAAARRRPRSAADRVLRRRGRPDLGCAHADRRVRRRTAAAQAEHVDPHRASDEPRTRTWPPSRRARPRATASGASSRSKVLATAGSACLGISLDGLNETADAFAPDSNSRPRLPCWPRSGPCRGG